KTIKELDNLLSFIEKDNEEIYELLSFIEKDNEKVYDLLPFIEKYNVKIDELLSFVGKGNVKIDELLPFFEKDNEKDKEKLLLASELFLQDIETQKNNAYLDEEQLKISIACNALNLYLYGSVENSLYEISLYSGGFDESMDIDIEYEDLKKLCKYNRSCDYGLADFSGFCFLPHLCYKHPDYIDFDYVNRFSTLITTDGIKLEVVLGNMNDLSYDSLYILKSDFLKIDKSGGELTRKITRCERFLKDISPESQDISPEIKKNEKKTRTSSALLDAVNFFIELHYPGESDKPSKLATVLNHAAETMKRPYRFNKDTLSNWISRRPPKDSA
ncbi:TPA: hypothetical protein JW635_004709, partial [Escherichia coli]|nr:hypothetical protein [Escherichia coli]